LRAAHSTLSTPQTGCTRAHTPLRAGTNAAFSTNFNSPDVLQKPIVMRM